MQPEQPLIAPTLMGRGGDTALGMEQRSPEQRPPSAASPRAAVQVVLLQPLLAAASVPLYAGPIQWMGQLAGPISGFVGGGTLPLSDSCSQHWSARWLWPWWWSRAGASEEDKADGPPADALAVQLLPTRDAQ